MASYPPPERRTGNTVLGRAFAAGAALVAGAVAITGIFVAKIAHSYAATHSRTAVTNRGDENPSVGGGSGGDRLSVPQQNQAPLGGSNGS